MATADQDVDPKERADLLMADLFPLYCGHREAGVLEHRGKVDDDRNHADQAVIGRSEQPCEHRRASDLHDKFHALRSHGRHSASN
jgi:hypothetical protein